MKKNIFTKILLVVVFVMTFTATIQLGYSYFDSLQTEEIETINIGQWTYGNSEWDPNATYLTGDHVTYNGQEYVALKDVPAGKVPGDKSSKNFWAVN